ncbi:MAG: AAA family ATPase [Bacteroidetes bacterium]|nr:AAA family ATPase [Bacteroidota bacterium]
MKYKRIYVAATGQHVGKTTSTLGLVYSFRKAGYNVGYSKPVGQEFVELGDLKADKDALLFSKFMDFQLSAETHSPVILGQGATKEYLDHPSPEHYRARIFESCRVLEEEHQMVVFEGTGHPGVGSVVDLSNADVAHMLDAAVIMVVKGGIGNTIDRLNMSLALFRERNVPVVGVIVNKVRPDKMDMIDHYLRPKFTEMGLPLLGLVPFDQSLSNPMMYSVCNAIAGQVLKNEDYLDNQIEDIIAGSLVDRNELKQFSNLLLVVSSNRLEEAIRKITVITNRAGHLHSPLSGIIITNDTKYPAWINDYVEKNKIPLIYTNLDTFGSVVKISRIEVKINTRTPHKVERACQLIDEYVDISEFI